jgi:signal transduction histidine kinase
MKKRSGRNVEFFINEKMKNITALISPPLFDWVIENLIKNALDAMGGKGKIVITIDEDHANSIMDISDTGKGISSFELRKIFNAGFTTKKRGWGLGLTLAKRIIEQYHHGKIFVLSSEMNKGTTFRIMLMKR